MPKTSKKAASAKAEMRHVSTMIVGTLSKKLGPDGEEWFYDLLWNNDRAADETFTTRASAVKLRSSKVAMSALKDHINSLAEKYMDMLGDSWTYTGTIVTHGSKKVLRF